MATHKSAAKRARQSVRRNTINSARRTQVHNLITKFDHAIGGGTVDIAIKTLRAAESALARAAGQGILHKKTASRKISRLAKRLKKIAGK